MKTILVVIFYVVALNTHAQLRGPDTFRFKFKDSLNTQVEPIVNVHSLSFNLYKNSLEFTKNEFDYYYNHTGFNKHLIVANHVFLPLSTTINAVLSDKTMSIIIFNYNHIMPEFTEIDIEFIEGTFLYVPENTISVTSQSDKKPFIKVSDHFMLFKTIQPLGEKLVETDFSIYKSHNSKVTLSHYITNFLSTTEKGKSEDAILPYFENNNPIGYVYLSTNRDRCTYINFSEELLKIYPFKTSK
jgi:hypothetical protein